MAEKKPAPLHYFAFFASDWLGSPSVRRMKREERGDFVDLMCFAWGDGTKEPSLEASDLEGMSERVKAKWIEQNGRFYNEKLSAVWREGQVRHSQAVRRGKASGRARRERKRLQTESKPSRNEGEQSRLGMVFREEKDSLSRGAGGVADAAPAPASSGIQERREAGGMARLPDADGILRMAGVPRSA